MKELKPGVLLIPVQYVWAMQDLCEINRWVTSKEVCDKLIIEEWESNRRREWLSEIMKFTTELGLYIIRI